MSSTIWYPGGFWGMSRRGRSRANGNPLRYSAIDLNYRRTLSASFAIHSAEWIHGESVFAGTLSGAVRL